MRLKIKLKANGLRISRNYQYAIQGWIYSLLRTQNNSEFLHDRGFEDGQQDKRFKLFVFSNLRGKFRVEQDDIIFTDSAYLYIASLTPAVIRTIYEALLADRAVKLLHHTIPVEALTIEDLEWFPGTRTFVLETLSPVTAYRSKDKKFEYFSPDDKEFEVLCRENLQSKNRAIQNIFPDLQFSIVKSSRIKKRLVYIKNTFFVAYSTELLVEANYDALNLIYNTGLSAKGSAGFGMMEIRPHSV